MHMERKEKEREKHSACLPKGQADETERQGKARPGPRATVPAGDRFPAKWTGAWAIDG